jgi:hypothetical protein
MECQVSRRNFCWIKYSRCCWRMWTKMLCFYWFEAFTGVWLIFILFVCTEFVVSTGKSMENVHYYDSVCCKRGMKTETAPTFWRLIQNLHQHVSTSTHQHVNTVINTMSSTRQRINWIPLSYVITQNVHAHRHTDTKPPVRCDGRVRWMMVVLLISCLNQHEPLRHTGSVLSDPANCLSKLCSELERKISSANNPTEVRNECLMCSCWRVGVDVWQQLLYCYCSVRIGRIHLKVPWAALASIDAKARRTSYNLFAD